MTEFSVDDRVLVPGVVKLVDLDGYYVVGFPGAELDFAPGDLRPDTGGRDLTAQDVAETLRIFGGAGPREKIAEYLNRIARGDAGSAGDDEPVWWDCRTGHGIGCPHVTDANLPIAWGDGGSAGDDTAPPADLPPLPWEARDSRVLDAQGVELFLVHNVARWNHDRVARWLVDTVNAAAGPRAGDDTAPTPEPGTWWLPVLAEAVAHPGGLPWYLQNALRAALPALRTAAGPRADDGPYERQCRLLRAILAEHSADTGSGDVPKMVALALHSLNARAEHAERMLGAANDDTPLPAWLSAAGPRAGAADTVPRAPVEALLAHLHDVLLPDDVHYYVAEVRRHLDAAQRPDENGGTR